MPADPAAPLTLHDDGAVRLLTFNRPAKRNALNAALIAALVQVLADAETDERIAVLVITGAGRSFCAGADIEELATLRSADSIRTHARAGAALHKRLAGLAIPTVAAVEGHALGAGCGLALACDITIAAEGASFGYPELGRGVLPALVMPNLLRLAGRRTAFELLAGRKRLAAQEARDRGLINRVVPTGEALAAALQTAAELATARRDLLVRIKTLMRGLESLPLDEAFDLAAEANAEGRLAALSSERDGLQG